MQTENNTTQKKGKLIMTLIEKITAELTKRLEKANFSTIYITMKYNDDVIEITPCCWGEKNSLETCEYFLMNSTVVNLYGAETLREVATTIANYEHIVKDAQSEIIELKNHIKKYGEKTDWQWVSDWHKDLFGHRPHVSTNQIIRWANSPSMESARFFI